jgi:hypothetical protein
MSTGRTFPQDSERGSAMVIAVLVMAILTLLGVSFLLMADTENKIAENEKLSSQALYFGEGITREVKRWFDRPPYSTIGDRNLVRPTIAVMNRTLRSIDVDGPGPTAAVAADGSTGAPYYKRWTTGPRDLDGDGNDDIFDKPYRSALVDMLVGTKDGPDIRMDRAANSATATFLDALADKVMPNFPNGAAGIRARIKKVDVYAPPYIDVGGGNWQRFGMATVSTEVQILRNPGAANELLLADRVVVAVLNETPFPGPFGPFHSCDEINFNGEFRLHWGISTAVGDVNPPGSLGNNNKMDFSIPRATPPTPKVDLIYGYNDNAIFNTLKTNLEAGAGKIIDDPWYEFFAGGAVNTWGALPSPQAFGPPIATDQDKSNRFQNFPGGVGCPMFDYDTWKTIARSGGSDVHFYSWDNGTQFRENGVGAATDFVNLTDNKTGLFFFDTADGIAPHDFDATKLAANLTPEISISAGSYGARGFLYLNAQDFTVSGSPGRPATLTMPGEPFQDTNMNGVHDAGEGYINLNYNSLSSVSDDIRGSATDDFGNSGGGPIYNAKGKTLGTPVNALVWGVLYTSGQFDAQGNTAYVGSVVTYAGTKSPTSAGTPDFYWDPTLKDQWPPIGWDLPRVVITRWQTDL